MYIYCKIILTFRLAFARRILVVDEQIIFTWEKVEIDAYSHRQCISTEWGRKICIISLCKNISAPLCKRGCQKYDSSVFSLLICLIK